MSGKLEKDETVVDPDDPMVKRRPTINPYREATKLLLRRIAWDVRPESWRSRRILRGWKDRFTKQKAVVVCNGPSLLKTDLSLLDGVFSFGLNKINLLFDRSVFRPSCIVAVNPFVIEQNADFFNSTSLPLFLDSVAVTRGLVGARESVVFMHSSSNGFARDCSVSICQGHTVTYVAMQLAFHMGFREIALVGADHDFAVGGAPNKTVVSGERDESHFDPRYFAGGVKWQLPDLLESDVSYMRAKRTFEAFGGRIVNATEGGKLDVFERMELAEFVEGAG
jgi:hypothetical protein